MKPHDVTENAPLHAGLEGIVVAHTAISDVDGERGELVIAGAAAECLARLPSLTFESAASNVLRAGGFDAASTAPAALTATLGRLRVAAWHDNVGISPRATQGACDAMDALRAGLAQLPVTGDDTTDALAAIAATPVIAARWYGAATAQPPLGADHALDTMRMLGVAAPSQFTAQALARYCATVMDHGLNASTFAARVVASTGSDMISAIVAGIGALKGPLHGGAPGPVLDMLDAIGAPGRAKAWLAAELDAGHRIMGMGHRIYRVRDPRAAVFEMVIADLAAQHIATPRLALARAVEQAAVELLRERKPDRPLCANVEFYTAVLLDTLQIPRELFTAMFAVGRVVGWAAHVVEQRRTGKLIRPASVYVGAHA
ncbi:MAG: citrate synthase [Kofleriaceae bacterium]|nr:citrate synthase [Kofleriaceae bacterium]